MQEIVALGVVTVSCCGIKVRQWCGLKGDYDEQGKVKVWIKLRSVSPYIWTMQNLEYVVKNFGNMIELDEDTLNGSQFIDAVMLIECKSRKDIPYKIMIFIGILIYVVTVSILSILSEEERL